MSTNVWQLSLRARTILLRLDAQIQMAAILAEHADRDSLETAKMNWEAASMSMSVLMHPFVTQMPNVPITLVDSFVELVTLVTAALEPQDALT